MSYQCRIFICAQWIAAGVLGALSWYFLPSTESFAAFFFGVVLFVINLTVLAVLVDRLLRKSVDGSGGSPVRRQGLFGLAFLKLMIVGVGLVVGLVTLRLNPYWLVAGSVAGLASTTFLSVLMGKKRLFSIRDLRY